MDWDFFYIDESLLKAEDLEEAYNRLPTDFKTALVLREDQVEIGGFKQFLSYYGDKRLRFKNTESEKKRAEDLFISIFFDNRFTIEQIKKIKETIDELVNLEKNWKTVTTYKGQGESKHKSQQNQSNTDKNSSEDSNKTTTIGLGSDNNSSGLIEGQTEELVYLKEEDNVLPNKIKYPVNTITNSSVEVVNKGSGESTYISLQALNSEDSNNNSSTSESSNMSEDLKNYIYFEFPELRRKFWSKFGRLFYF